MKFTPKAESELIRFTNLPDGIYPFTVLESEEIASKSAKNAGRMMFALKLNVHGPDFDRHVYDYFADWFSEWKLKHFCDVVKLGADYQLGTLDAMRNALTGRQGFVRITTERQGGRKEKNVVEDYELPAKLVVASPGLPTPKDLAMLPRKVVESAKDDDVPF